MARLESRSATGGPAAILRASAWASFMRASGAATEFTMPSCSASAASIVSPVKMSSQAFVKRGIAPDWGGSWFLPRVVGAAKACELIFTGDTIDAAEALRLGIVNSVAAPEALMDEAQTLARRIAAGPPVALRLSKRAIYHNLEADLRAGLEFETFAQGVCKATDDAKEGVKAFMEKRAPVFRGR